MNQLKIVRDVPNKKITVTRSFNAKPEHVWKAWTERELLDQWWAPKPWKAETKELHFKVGGHWLYAMVGPQGERHWSKANFTSIETFISFETNVAFCDEWGNVNPAMPASEWKNDFFAEEDGTRVVVQISFPSAADFNTLMEMGFEQGFTSGLANLEHYLRTGFEKGKE